MHEDENEASEEANITDCMKASKARLIRQNSILQTLYSVSSGQKGGFLSFRSNFFLQRNAFGSYLTPRKKPSSESISAYSAH